MLEKVSVMKEKWDYLIVLDACRYDVFSELYKNYLNGELKKVISLGRDTTEWCKESFKDKYDDVIYISANPYINSKVEIKGFNAKNHFYKIIDIWNDGWSEELGTVHPREVNKAIKKVKNNYPKKRLIIHYLQPHEPYLGYNLKLTYPKPQISLAYVLIGIKNSQNNKSLILRQLLIKTNFLNVIHFVANKLVGKTQAYKIYLYIRKLLKLTPVSPMDAVQRIVGYKGLRKLYIKNLEIVLEYVSEIIKDLHGTIIITSDHGELLGEDGFYGHGEVVPPSNPFLLEIPWLKIIKK